MGSSFSRYGEGLYIRRGVYCVCMGSSFTSYGEGLYIRRSVYWVCMGSSFTRYGEGLYILRSVLESVTRGFSNAFQLQQVRHVAHLSQGFYIIL